VRRTGHRYHDPSLHGVLVHLLGRAKSSVEDMLCRTNGRPDEFRLNTLVGLRETKLAGGSST
jgi:hypothetical protein